jgi:hypothetical protein
LKRYYLNQRCGGDFLQDLEGALFESLADARLEAIASIREAISNTVKSGFIELGWSYEICNLQGDLLTTVFFGETIVIRGAARPIE